MLRCGVAVAVVVGLLNPVAADDAPAPGGDLGALQGYWKPLSLQYEGRPLSKAEVMGRLTAVFDQAEHHLYYKETGKPPIKLARTVVTLDPTATPKTITFEYAVGDLKGQKRHGIYEVAGNELRLCYGPAEKPRPTQFAAPDKSEYYLEVWAKQPGK